jgi:ATP-binding cassette subfamily B protein
VTTRRDSHWRLFARLVAPHGRLVAAYGLALSIATALPLTAAVLLSRFVDLAVAGASTGRLVRIAAAYTGVGLLGSLVSVLVVWRSTALAWAITDTLRHELAGFVLGADLAFHRDHTRGELVSRADDDVTAMAMFLSQFVARAVSVLAIAVGAVAVLTVIRPELGAVLGVSLTVVLTVVWAQRNVSLPQAIVDRDARGRLSGHIEERVSGAEDIASLGGGAHSMARFAVLADAVVTAKRAVTRRQMRVSGSIRVALASTEATMLVAGAAAYAAGRVSLGNVFLGVRFATAARAPIEGLMWRLNEVQGATGSATRVLDLLASRPTHPERSQPWPEASVDLELRHVSLVYAEDEGPVLHDITLTVRAGRSLGLVGRSGSGKTSMGRLMLRLTAPTSGAVCVGGTDVSVLSETAFRHRVAGVPQEVQLFPGSIRENVSMFDGSVGDGAIAAALDAVGLGAWLAAQRDGLDSGLLGRTDVGTGMSAGEAQLLALARALVRDPDVVVLDEATSRVDPVTQGLVKHAVAELLRGRTSVVIAHRLDTLDICDDIAVLEQGRIVEHGERVALAADPASRFGRLLRIGGMLADDASVDELIDATTGGFRATSGPAGDAAGAAGDAAGPVGEATATPADARSGESAVVGALHRVDVSS